MKRLNSRSLKHLDNSRFPPTRRTAMSRSRGKSLGKRSNWPSLLPHSTPNSLTASFRRTKRLPCKSNFARCSPPSPVGQVSPRHVEGAIKSADQEHGIHSADAPQEEDKSILG